MKLLQGPLLNRNYRIYLVGQGLSQMGTWMQNLAMGWLVLKLTNSGALLGLVTAAQFTPTLLLGLYAGAVADRLNRWRILQTVQMLAAVVAAVLGVLVYTDTIRIGSLFVLAAIFGIVNSFDTPVRTSFTYEMVGPDDVTGAIGYSSSVNNVARVIGPALSGLLIANVGIATPFFVNAASYLCITVSLFLMDRSKFFTSAPVQNRQGLVREGVRVVWSDTRLRVLILMTLVIGTLAYENQIALPLLAKYTFGLSATGFGIFSSALGVGSAIGGIAIARFGKANHRRVGFAALALGISMLVASFMPNTSLFVVMLFIVGACSVMFITFTSATLQLVVPQQLRGRVMALYVTAIIGTTPIGGPIIGWIGGAIDARATYITGGVACILTALVAWRTLQNATRSVLSEAVPLRTEQVIIGEEISAEKDSGTSDFYAETNEPPTDNLKGT